MVLDHALHDRAEVQRAMTRRVTRRERAVDDKVDRRRQAEKPAHTGEDARASSIEVAEGPPGGGAYKRTENHTVSSRQWQGC